MAQHESWISLDPILGCPASCVYCYLGPKGLNKRAPMAPEYSPELIYQKLNEYRLFKKSEFTGIPSYTTFPICIGNHTDMCLTPKNREYLVSLLYEHKRVMPDVPLCVVTKAKLSKTFLECVSQIGINIIFFISLSFLPAEVEKGAPSSESRLENFERIAQFANLKAIHFWRPIISLNVQDQGVARQHIQSLKKVGATASVITGLKYGESLANMFNWDVHHPLHNYFGTHVGQGRLKDEIFEPEIQKVILKVADELSYPVYLHTSCAVSYLLKQPDYNATFRRLHLEEKCLTSTCPLSQRDRCFSYKCSCRQPPIKLLDQIAGYLNMPSSSVNYSQEDDAIIVKGTLTQEEQTFLTQATSFSVRGEELVPTLEWIGSINR